MICRPHRQAQFATARHEVDAVVIGAGAVGAAIHAQLVTAGQRVVLVDRGDVGGGASQGSANLVWGGLLYLSQGRIDQVLRWCRERNRQVADPGAGVAALTCAYRVNGARRSPRLVQAGLLGYWLLGGARGPRPRQQAGHLLFHEARLLAHDARWTWERLAALGGHSWIATWSDIEQIQRVPAGWELELHDQLDGGRTRLHATTVINAAGAWAGQIDQRAGIQHGWQVVASRGVSVVVAGQARRALMIEHPDERDVLSLVPFPAAAAAVWGSTETLVADPDQGMQPSVAELRSLVDWHRRLIGPLQRPQLLGLRCGLRALALPRGAKLKRSQDLTRSVRIINPASGWFYMLGGKLTGAAAVARTVARQMGLQPDRANLPQSAASTPPTIHFPGLGPVPDPAWCRDHEQCWTLGSWLRRRSPIAQVIPRGGLGLNDEHRPLLSTIAHTIMGEAGAQALHDHTAQIEREEVMIREALGPRVKESA